MQLHLTALPSRLAICRLSAEAPIPSWPLANGTPLSLTRTADELSVVCSQDTVPKDATAERGWRCLKVEGALDLEQVGILAQLARPLVEAGIPTFALSDLRYRLPPRQPRAPARRRPGIGARRSHGPAFADHSSRDTDATG